MHALPTSDLLAPILAIVLLVVVFVGIPLYLLGRMRRNAWKLGYPGLRSYWRAIPRTDAEKLAAIELTLHGLVLCVLGVVFPPLMLIGVFPLYYGGRKLAVAWLGLEMLDNGDEKTV